MERGIPTATDLPKAQVKRIVKTKLQDVYSTGETYRSNMALSKDALTAFAESGRVFISHLTSAANDVCRDAKRCTVTGDDVLQALRNIDFEEFMEPLQSNLEEFRAGLKEKNRKKQESRLLKESAAASQKEGNAVEGGDKVEGEAVKEVQPKNDGDSKDVPTSA